MAKVQLRRVSIWRDARYLYEALARRPAHIGISHRQMPPYWCHLRFMLSRPYAAWDIIEVEGRPGGNIYLTRQNEIGIFLDPDFQGRGIGKVAIQLLRIQHGQRRYLANIAPGNEVSIGFFRSLGFKHIQNTYQLEGE